MNNPHDHAIDPRLDLVFERIVPVSKEAVWNGWTVPAYLVQWFTPLPWTTTACEIDLRPGGKFRTVMRSPEGQEFDNTGCYLEIVPNERLVWTSALKPGFRPALLSEGEFHMTATILLESIGEGTKYTAIVRHADEGGRSRHEEMGFLDGWGKALQQLVDRADTFR